MSLTSVGRQYLMDSIIGVSSPPFDFTDSYIGVGDSDFVFSESQTDLLGTNKVRVSIDEGFPKRDDEDPNVLIYRATFTEGIGNFTWNEWGLFNDDSEGVMLFRMVESVGVKTLGTIWVFTLKIKFISC
jgi:hypothetical protein